MHVNNLYALLFAYNHGIYLYAASIKNMAMRAFCFYSSDILILLKAFDHINVFNETTLREHCTRLRFVVRTFTLLVPIYVTLRVI